MKAETEIIWYKDSLSIGERDEAAKKLEKKDDVLTFNIGKVGYGGGDALPFCLAVSFMLGCLTHKTKLLLVQIITVCTFWPLRYRNTNLKVTRRQ